MNPDPLPVELLVGEDARRLEAALAAPRPIITAEHRIDIDAAAADPIHDHTPSRAPGYKINRVLGILDQLEKENSNRRFTA